MKIDYNHERGMCQVVSDDNSETYFESTSRAECDAWVMESNIRDTMLTALKELELRTRQFLNGDLVTFPAALLTQVRMLIEQYEAIITDPE